MVRETFPRNTMTGRPQNQKLRFTSTDRYIATRDLEVAVNAAVALERPLLVKGEPGTGKTMLAEEVAARPRPAADPMAHQVDHQGAAGALRV